VRSRSEEIELTEEQVELLESRLAALDADGELGDSWDNVKARILKT